MHTHPSLITKPNIYLRQFNRSFNTAGSQPRFTTFIFTVAELAVTLPLPEYDTVISLEPMGSPVTATVTTPLIHRGGANERGVIVNVDCTGSGAATHIESQRDNSLLFDHGRLAGQRNRGRRDRGHLFLRSDSLPNRSYMLSARSPGRLWSGAPGRHIGKPS